MGGGIRIIVLEWWCASFQLPCVLRTSDGNLPRDLHCSGIPSVQKLYLSWEDGPDAYAVKTCPMIGDQHATEVCINLRASSKWKRSGPGPENRPHVQHQPFQFQNQHISQLPSFCEAVFCSVRSLRCSLDSLSLRAPPSFAEVVVVWKCWHDTEGTCWSFMDCRFR